MNFKSGVSLIPLLVVTIISVAQKKQEPESNVENCKLVVGIIVDQMKPEYLKRFWNKFGNDGFKRLTLEGRYWEEAHFNYAPTVTGPGHASVFTGTTPFVHGILGNLWYSETKKGLVYCAEDLSVKSAGYNSKVCAMSPKNLESSTISDEIRLQNGFKGKSIGIALKDRGAIFPAGHSANAAYWFDDQLGAWVTSTYYMPDVPKWVRDYNNKSRPKALLSEDWQTLLPLENYTESWPDNNRFEQPFTGEAGPQFPHRIPQLMKYNGNLGMIRTTPFGNTITFEMAVEALENESLGQDEYTDMLAISFSSTDYIGHRFGTGSVEIEDTYLRFDNELGDFLRKLDKEVGKGKYLVFLTSDHGAMDNVSFLKENKIKSGLVNDSILTLNLQKKYFERFGDSLVLAVINQHVYLNDSAIWSKKLNQEEVLQWGITQLLNTDGISQVLTRKSLMDGSMMSWPLNLIRQGVYIKRTGHLVYNLAPNVAEYYATGTTHGSPYYYDTHVPLFFFGFGVMPGKETERVEITQIAPAVSKITGCGIPSGSPGISLPLK